ncbi:MAG: nicotinate (nicotinamide) nucleotide adenylyltransferase [Elusimicrobiota bacterium]|nr:nicotinate (nicotinamide) nucleotide adenylyltransferase [Elusimicrobiota bacterium]
MGFSGKRGKNLKLKRLAVFGGSFDPVHIGHIEIAKSAQQNFDLSKVIFVCAWAAPHKPQHFASAQDRLKMLSMAVQNIENFEISLFELSCKNVVYSYQTLDYFQKIYPDYEILMIIGSDSLNGIKTWKKIDYIVSKYKFIVANRTENLPSAANEYIKNCLFIDREFENISSKKIRALLAAKDEQAQKYLTPKVYRYIKENGLYGC